MSVPQKNKSPESRILARLQNIYPDPASSASTAEAITALIRKWRPKMSPAPAGWSENDSFLITYAETLAEKKAPPLATLSRFLKNHCPDILSFIHILPFYPSTSDHGFSVVDYRKVATDLGSWNDVENLARERRVTFDCVLNHVSQESDYVQGFISGNTDREDFCIVESSAFDSSQVTRPRQSPLFHSFDRPDQSQVSLWTTFSRDQVDLNFRNPAVLIEILDILLGYAARGASMIRLDAIPYLWKESGTTCIHLKQTHEIIRLIRAVFDAVSPHVILLSETNVPHQENIKYFGPDERDEAQIIYNFSLAPLLLHTVHTGNATALTHWASNLDDFGEACTYLNVTATHDGIGIRPAEDCLAPDDRSRLLEITSAHGGFVNYKRNADGSDTPYELNITWFDALNNPHSNPPTPLSLQIDRMVLSQAIPMALKGIPALYIHSLLGSRNDLSRVNPGDSTTFRTINRSQISIDTLLQDLNDPTTRRHQVFHALTKLLRIRQTQPAFHPDAAQQILDLGPHTFALLRQSQSSSLVQSIIAVFNVTAQPQTIPTSSLPLSKEPLTDLISGQPIAAPEISINPYQFRWLTTPR